MYVHKYKCKLLRNTVRFKVSGICVINEKILTKYTHFNFIIFSKKLN